jgi:hypothetical protein
MDPFTWALIIGALVGAAAGGVTSAATNQNPWKGAAVGGVLGAATAGVGSLWAGPAASIGTSAAESAITAGAESAAASASEAALAAGVETAMAEPLVTGAESAVLAGTQSTVGAGAESIVPSAAQSAMPGLSAPMTGGTELWPKIPQYLQYGGWDKKIDWLGQPLLDAFNSRAGEAGQFGGQLGSQIAYKPPAPMKIPNYYQAFGGLRNSITKDPMFKDAISNYVPDNYGLMFGGKSALG